MALEKLTQQYEQQANIRVPPGVSIIMLRDGSFWDGGVQAGEPVQGTASLTGGVVAEILADGNVANGFRIVNWLDAPVYISQSDPPSEGAPSDFCPPAEQDQNGVIWPGQYEFPTKPTGPWYVLCASSGDIGVMIW